MKELPRALATDFSVETILDDLLVAVVEELHLDGAAVTLYLPAAATRTAGDVGDADVAPLLSLPLRQGDTQLGALNLYRTGGGAFDEATMTSAQTLAEVAVAYLLVARARLELDESSKRSRESSAHGGQAVRALRSSEERKTAILASAIDAVITIDDRGRIIEFNPAAEETFGRSEDDVDGTDLAALVQPPLVLGERWIGLEDHTVVGSGVLAHRYELVGTRRDGSTFPVEVTITPVDGLGPAFFIVFIRDLTQRDADAAELRRLGARVHQTERLESLGALAGVVAHDFNNLLTVVLNYASFIAEAASNDGETRRYATEIVSASERASRLTRQLLQFARREPVRTERLRIDEVIEDLRELLDRGVGERVELVVRTSDGVPMFIGDRGQTEQLLMNLAVNARDAMSDGGRLTIETALLEQGDSRDIRLTVSDTGAGMSSDVASHAFDPFFTTKRIGDGAGLGLSTVYGIVADAGGEIEMVSSPGEGTIFTITLPAASPNGPSEPNEPSSLDAGVAPDATTGGGRTILVVEDEDAVRAITVTMLARNGYRVLEASEAGAALALAETETFELLLTDVVMPGLTGRELVDRLRDQGRASRVLFMSGYSSGIFSARPTIEAREAMLPKPFNETSLLNAVRAALDEDTQPSTRAAG